MQKCALSKYFQTCCNYKKGKYNKALLSYIIYGLWMIFIKNNFCRGIFVLKIHEC